jgi:hypothetical protein
MATTRFSFQSYLIRLFLAILLVFSTYNPTGHSYIHWILREMSFEHLIFKLFIGMVVLIGWIVFLRATMLSLGKIGLILTIGFFGILFWLIVDLLQNWIPLQGLTFIQYFLLLIISFVLATGMSWSHVRKRLTGQVDVDDVET